MRSQRVILVLPRSDVSLKINSNLGEATLQEAVYNPILDQLADHQHKSLGQLEDALKSSGINFAQIIQAVMVLSSNGALMAVQDDATTNMAHERTKRLNNYLMTKARGSNELNYLASPVTGGGISVSRFQQLFLLALQQNHKQPQEQAKFVWDLLAMQGQRLIKDGKTLETAEANIAELNAQANEFMTKRLDILKALKIA